MPVFVLTPFNPKWPTAHFKKVDAIVVRASSEANARDLVKLVTFNSDKSKIGMQMHNPWQNRSYSKCALYQGTEFSKEGKAAILAPASLSEAFEKLKK